MGTLKILSVQESHNSRQLSAAISTFSKQNIIRSRKWFPNMTNISFSDTLMEDYKFLFKVVLVGNAGVGKTCLVRRFTQGLFPPGQGATIGVDFMIKTVEVEGEKIKVILEW